MQIARRRSSLPKDWDASKANSLSNIHQRYFRQGAPEDSEFHSDVRTYHYLANIYHWSPAVFYDEAPLGLIKELLLFIAKKQEKGYLGHFEVMMQKALMRDSGYKEFDT